MANKKKSKKWSPEDYASTAKDFVACYGPGYCRDEFMDDYLSLWNDQDELCASSLERPDPDLLQAAIWDVEHAEKN
jgi:hypothetical protein